TEIAARNDLEIRKRQLELLIGRAAPGLAPLGKQFVLRQPEPDTMERWAADALENHLHVRLNRESLTLAGQDIERNRAGHLPTIDAFATFSDQNSNSASVGLPVFGTDNSRVVGVQLAVPIYQGGLTSSLVREAVANEDRARQDLENARRTAELTARQAYLGVT